MKKTSIVLIVIIVSILLGIASTTVLFVGSYLALIPWGCVGIIIGVLNTNRNLRLVCGLLYGFILTSSFLISGDKNFHLSFLIFIIILSAVGGVCGIVLAVIGNVLRNKFDGK